MLRLNQLPEEQLICAKTGLTKISKVAIILQKIIECVIKCYFREKIL